MAEELGEVKLASPKKWVASQNPFPTLPKRLWESLVGSSGIAADMRFNEMIVSPNYCVDRRGETLYRGDDTSQLRWGDARA